MQLQNHNHKSSFKGYKGAGITGAFSMYFATLFQHPETAFIFPLAMTISLLLGITLFSVLFQGMRKANFSSHQSSRAWIWAFSLSLFTSQLLGGAVTVSFSTPSVPIPRHPKTNVAPYLILGLILGVTSFLLVREELRSTSKAIRPEIKLLLEGLATGAYLLFWIGWAWASRPLPFLNLLLLTLEAYALLGLTWLMDRLFRPQITPWITHQRYGYLLLPLLLTSLLLSGSLLLAEKILQIPLPGRRS